MKKLRQEFLNPPLPLRGAPFWSWNDALKVEELVHQLRDMKAHGMGGFFMHSREGLETEYMGTEWLECVRETVRAAAEEGMGAWLYDEDRWPSGAAGGLVPARGGDAFRAKVITIEECDTLPKEKEDVLAIFKAVIKDNTIVSAQRLPLDSTARLETGETFLILRREVSGPSEWFNDDAYADNLNPDAVAAFLDITYEAYRKEVGDEFGKAIPGIFTDEPNIPWTDGLVAYFQEHRGYDLLDVMPWVFYDGKGAAKARHDYWRTVGQRYVEAYSQQLGEWCERYGLAFTGHYLYENELGRAILANGAVMPHYRYQHVPGIDMLTEQTHEYLTIKQCTSVAHQFNRQRVLSETYGCSSWEFTFEGQKWVGDWQYVLGVNLRCQHLALYTLRGCRKRDYPPAFNYNTTWWKYNGVVEDYFARVGRVLTEGQPVRDVLLLHPVATGWSMLGAGEASANQVDAYGENLNTFARALLAAHYDFDFGDEQIMATDARVDGETLWVGQAPYKVVVIPPDTRTLLSTTVDLLEAFLKAGGSVIAVEPLPTMIETETSERLAALLAHAGVTVVPDKTGLQGALEPAVPRRVSLRNMQGQQAASLLYMQRAFDDKFAYFVVNTDRHNGYDVDLALEGGGRLEEWDPMTGETHGLPAREEQGKLCFSANLGPAGSRIYVVDPQAPAVAGKTELEPMDLRALRRIADASLVGPVCPFTRTDPNLLTLDMCQYRLGDGEWSKTMEVWHAQSQIREALDMKPHPKDGAPVALRFAFRVRDIPSKPVYLLIEDAALFDISLNGQPASSDPVGWYLDRGFHKVTLPALQTGVNTIEIGCAYTNHMELEDCFLLGDFGVSIDRVIIDEPQTLHFGDWTTQGYPHYAGSMIYHGQMLYEPQVGKRVRVYLGDYEAVDIALHVNGTLAGHIPWISENGLDITDHLGPGLNNIDIEVVSSLGPTRALSDAPTRPTRPTMCSNRGD